MSLRNETIIPAEVLKDKPKFYRFDAMGFFPPSEPSIFCYKDLDELNGNHLGYHLHKNETYLQFTLLQGADQRLKPLPMGLTGWKLHISVDKYHLSKAWECVLPVLALKQALCFKILLPHKLWSAQDRYRGKQFTIYFRGNPIPEGEWHTLMRELEKHLIQIGCLPGQIHPANKLIAGSQFFSYRHDSHPEDSSKYIADIDAERYALEHPELKLNAYNLTNALDPFANINIAENYYKFSAIGV